MTAAQETEFVSLDDIATAHSMHAKTLRRRIQRWQIPTYADPHDLRKVLIRVADVDAIFQPRPIRRAQSEAAAAA